MPYRKEDHTFVICAYKESEFLEECIKSLKNQSIQTNIIMTTSTPCDYISNLAKKYKIKLYVNLSGGGISQDWNFAYSKVKTNLVTIAHQDDIYERDYSWKLISMINRESHPLIFFTNYGELRKGNKVKENSLLTIKRILLSPFKFRFLFKSRFVRRRILSLGSAICCPSVTLVKENLPDVIFKEGFRSNVDWEAWERISFIRGEFIYCSKILMYHRIHEESETSAIIGNNQRKNEDIEMFRKFWPKWIAHFLANIYQSSEKSNRIK